MSKEDAESFLLSLNEKLIRQVLEHPGWAEIKRILDNTACKLQNEINMPMVNESDALVKNYTIGRVEAFRKVEVLVRDCLSNRDLAARKEAEKAEVAARRQKVLERKTSAQTRGTEQSQ